MVFVFVFYICVLLSQRKINEYVSVPSPIVIRPPAWCMKSMDYWSKQWLRERIPGENSFNIMKKLNL